MAKIKGKLLDVIDKRFEEKFSIILRFKVQSATALHNVAKKLKNHLELPSSKLALNEDEVRLVIELFKETKKII